MVNAVFVSTKKELKSALEKKVEKIVITDRELAKNIKTIKSASNAALVTAVAATAVVATNFWNPIGWSVGLVGLTTGGVIAAAIIALSIGGVLVWVIYSEYDMKFGVKANFPDGTSAEVEMILEKK
jgi:hypothetical protein